MNLKPLLLPAFTFLALACTKDLPNSPEPPIAPITFPFEANYSINDLKVNAGFQPSATEVGQVASISEASGLAQSLQNRAYLWTHEDSGNDNLLFLLNKTKGDVVATYRIKGATNVDWEDMATGPGPLAGTNYLYIADIGDNQSARTDVSVYRIPEPAYHPADSGKTLELNLGSTLHFAYPDAPRDAEALMIDPITRDFFIITKRESRSRLYRWPFPQSEDHTDTLEFTGSFPFTLAVAADMSPDGTRVLVKTYSHILYWQKTDTALPMCELLATPPERAPHNPVQAQGEAICWDGKGSYFTLNEKFAGITPVLQFYGKN